MVELKMMDNPEVQKVDKVKACEDDAGVVDGNMEGSGDACKLIGCLAPMF